jgi:hypothetical protein
MGVRLLVAGAIAALAMAACTLLSGWRDLQDGQPPGEGGEDAAGPDGSDGPDVSEGSDVSEGFDACGLLTPTCGDASCQNGNVCCVPVGVGAQSASCGAGCSAGAEDTFFCTSSAQCAASCGQTVPCCFSDTVASCQSSCGDAMRMLCTPNMFDCPSGTRCLELPTPLGPPGYYSCQ